MRPLHRSPLPNDPAPIGQLFRIGASLGALWLALAAAPSGADWLIETRVSGVDAVEHPGRIYLDGPNLRLEVDDQPPARVIFRGDGPTMEVLDVEKRKVAVLDPATLKHLGEQMAAARKAVEARLAALPPEQRAALEAMMPKPAPALRDPLTLTKTDRTREVDGHTCRVRELRRGGDPAGEVCVIPWKEAGIDRSDLRAFRDLGKFQTDLAASAASPWTRTLSTQPYSVFDQLDGYPIASQQVDGDQIIATGKLSLPRKVPADRGRYEAPPDWSRIPIGPPTVQP